MNSNPDPLNRYGPAITAANQAAAGVRINGEVATVREGFLTMAFVWMFVGLLLSALTTYLTMTNEAVLAFTARNYFILFIVEIGFVVAVSAAINRLGALIGLGLFFGFALLNGLVLGVVVYAYTSATGWAGVTSAFLGAAAIFGSAALYGVVTKRDLMHLGGILTMGLIGLIVVMVINIFLGSSTIDFVIGLAGVAIFTGLTAWDVQRIQRGYLGNIRDRESASVLGALALYLDFVNLFLMLLRLFSRR
ncbi:MAG: Bax inhibitor-1/YccA family protein [Candidatus Limnocylindrales bacterium]